METIDLQVRFSVYNLTNSQTGQHSFALRADQVLSPVLRGRNPWQAPRYMQLVVSWRF